MARRVKTASYFTVGMVVLMGKYKNKKGRITAFSRDKWGNPTIVVEPIPLGRKKPKVLSLFKVWRADVVDRAKAQAAAKEEAAAAAAAQTPGHVVSQGRAQVQAVGAPLVLAQPMAVRVAARFQRGSGGTL